MTKKTAAEHMEDMAQEPTLDRFFERMFTTDPDTQTDEDRLRLINIERERRAIFIQKGESTRKEKDISDEG